MNALVQPVSGTVAQVVCPLYDPRRVRFNRARLQRFPVPMLEYANSLSLPAGRWPARGWVLLLRSDLNNLNLYRTDLKLVLNDSINGDLSLGSLTVVDAVCVSRGSAADPNAVYLVEVTDARGVLWSPWFAYPTSSAYNIRSPAYPGQYYSSSTNGGSAWTWSTMVGSLWGQMGSPPLLGAFPGLPSAPASTPENWWFPGVSCWNALCDILDQIAMTVAVDLTSATPYTITSDGANDAAFANLTSKYAGLIEDDLEPVEPGSGRVPGLIVVLFHRRNQYYGTEETIRNDSLQWSSTPLYSVSSVSPAPYNAAKGTHYIWSDFTVQYDINNVPLPADVATAATIAAREVTNYFGRIFRSTLGSMSRVYIGALPFATGSQVDGVRWRQDFRDRDRFGWVTELKRTGEDGPTWPEVAGRYDVRS